MRPCPYLLLLLPLVACAGPGAQTESRFTLLGNATVWSDYETNVKFDNVDLGQGPVTGEGSADIEDYTGFEGGIGVTTVVPGADGELPRKVSRFEIKYGLPTYELLDVAGVGSTEIDAWEISAGGRAFLGSSGRLAPFLSLHAVYTQWDEGKSGGLSGDLGEIDPQIAGRLGAGLEIALIENLAIDIGVDYTLPFVSPELDDGSGGTAEIDFEGLALRAGLSLSF